jgi:hypothetical protein
MDFLQNASSDVEILWNGIIPAVTRKKERFLAAGDALSSEFERDRPGFPIHSEERKSESIHVYHPVHQ